MAESQDGRAKRNKRQRRTTKQQLSVELRVPALKTLSLMLSEDQFSYEQFVTEYVLLLCLHTISMETNLVVHMHTLIQQVLFWT